MDKTILKKAVETLDRIEQIESSIKVWEIASSFNSSDVYDRKGYSFRVRFTDEQFDYIRNYMLDNLKNELAEKTKLFENL